MVLCSLLGCGGATASRPTDHATLEPARQAARYSVHIVSDARHALDPEQRAYLTRLGWPDTDSRIVRTILEGTLEVVEARADGSSALRMRFDRIGNSLPGHPIAVPDWEYDPEGVDLELVADADGRWASTPALRHSEDAPFDGVVETLTMALHSMAAVASDAPPSDGHAWVWVNDDQSRARRFANERSALGGGRIRAATRVEAADAQLRIDSEAQLSEQDARVGHGRVRATFSREDGEAELVLEWCVVPAGRDLTEVGCARAPLLAPREPSTAARPAGRRFEGAACDARLDEVEAAFRAAPNLTRPFPLPRSEVAAPMVGAGLVVDVSSAGVGFPGSTPDRVDASMLRELEGMIGALGTPPGEIYVRIHASTPVLLVTRHLEPLAARFRLRILTEGAQGAPSTPTRPAWVDDLLGPRAVETELFEALTLSIGACPGALFAAYMGALVMGNSSPNDNHLRVVLPSVLRQCRCTGADIDAIEHIVARHLRGTGWAPLGFFELPPDLRTLGLPPRATVQDLVERLARSSRRAAQQ